MVFDFKINYYTSKTDGTKLITLYIYINNNK